MKFKKSMLGAVLALAAPLMVAAPAHAATTQVVRFSVLGSAYCPQAGLYGISHVSINGGSGMQAEQDFAKSTQWAATSVKAVPPPGAKAYVTLTYHCKVKAGPIVWPGYGEPASASFWIYGSGDQPSHIVTPWSV